jgi:hypothetical protein
MRGRRTFDIIRTSAIGNIQYANGSNGNGNGNGNGSGSGNGHKQGGRGARRALAFWVLWTARALSSIYI